MIAGTLVVAGGAGEMPGYLMRRGSILLDRPPKSLSPSFVECGAPDSVFAALIDRHLIAEGILKRPLLGNAPRRYGGDNAVSGKGEILVSAVSGRRSALGVKSRARILAGEALEKEIDLLPRRGSERAAGLALRVAGNRPAPHHHIFAHRQSDALLMLVAQIGQMRIEEVVRLVAPPGCGEPHDLHQHVGKGVTGHGASRRRAPSRSRGTARRCR